MLPRATQIIKRIGDSCLLGGIGEDIARQIILECFLFILYTNTRRRKKEIFFCQVLEMCIEGFFFLLVSCKILWSCYVCQSLIFVDKNTVAFLCHKATEGKLFCFTSRSCV